MPATRAVVHINLPTFYEIQILELFTPQHSTDRNDASFIAAKISFSLEKRTENDKIIQLLDDGLVVQSNQPFYCIFPGQEVVVVLYPTHAHVVTRRNIF